MFIFLFILFALIAFWLFYRREIPTQAADPLTILKNRYAKGDISKDEFESIKNDLQA